MTFTVEDGTGLSNSNSYAAVADADTYLADRGVSSWAGGVASDKQAALVKASDFIDSMFMFNGDRNGATQAMSWPRTGASDVVEGYDIATNVVPTAIKRAVMELAYKVSTGTVLLKDLSRGGLYKSQTVGPLSVVYADGAPARTIYGVEGLLKGLLRPLPLQSDLNVEMQEIDTDNVNFYVGMNDNA